MLEWISKEIARICHQLEHCLFMKEERRVSLQAELSNLLKMRENFYLVIIIPKPNDGK